MVTMPDGSLYKRPNTENLKQYAISPMMYMKRRKLLEGSFYYAATIKNDTAVKPNWFNPYEQKVILEEQNNAAGC